MAKTMRLRGGTRPSSSVFSRAARRTSRAPRGGPIERCSAGARGCRPSQERRRPHKLDTARLKAALDDLIACRQLLDQALADG